MHDMKEYKPIALVFYKDGNGNRDALPLDESKLEAFKNVIENSKMVELEWVIIATNEIKEIKRSYKTTELEKYFYSRSPEERAYLTKRIKSRAWQKCNILESIAEMWEERAITTMMQWIEWRNRVIEEEKTTKVETKIEMTDKQRKEIMERFKNLKKSFSK